MTRLKYIITATIGLLFTVISCSDGDEIVRNIGVDVNHLVFSKEAETKTVKITVAKGDSYTVSWDGELWVTAVADVKNDEVSVTVDLNANPSLRQATIVVSLDRGLRNEIIKITQNGSDPILSVLPDEISFDFLEEKQIIEVESNTNWEVESDAEWLETRFFVQAGEIIVTAAENFDLSDRTTTLTITAGGYSKAVLIKQVSPPVFMIPYLATSNAPVKDVAAFEEARHSTFIYAGSGMPNVAKTKSPLIYEMRYTISASRVSIVTTMVNDKLMPDFFGSEGNKGKVHDFLLEQDFTYLFKGKDYFTKEPVECYWKNMGEESRFDYLITVNPKTSIVKYDMTLHMPDNPDYPTFDVFPYPQFAWETAQAPIDAWEADNGGTLIGEEDVDGLHHVVYQATDQYHMRVYYYENDKLVYIMYLFNDYKKIEIKEYTGSFSTNEKFAELLIKEGFSKTGAVRGYTNQAKDLALVAGVAQIEINGDYFGAMEFSPYSTIEGIGSANKFNSIAKYLPNKR